jgi:hypothetical protein
MLDLKAVEARSICEKCEEYDHVQGKPQLNVSSSIQDLVPLFTQLKDFMDEQAKIKKDVITKFEAMEKILENLYGKVTVVGSSFHQMLNMMKMLETQVGQLAGNPMGNKGRLPEQSQGPETVMAIQTHLGETEDHTKGTTEIATEGQEFEMLSQYMKMPPRYFRDMLANKHEKTLCDLGESLGVMPKDMFEELCLPLKPMAMCLEMGDDSIRYPVGIAEDAPVIKFDIYGKGSAFKFSPCFEVCNTFNVICVPPHRRFTKEEPKKKEELERKEVKEIKEVVASIKTKEQRQPMKTKKMTKPKNKLVSKMVRKWVPKIATHAKSVDLK